MISAIIVAVFIWCLILCIKGISKPHKKEVGESLSIDSEAIKNIKFWAEILKRGSCSRVFYVFRGVEHKFEYHPIELDKRYYQTECGNEFVEKLIMGFLGTNEYHHHFNYRHETPNDIFHKLNDERFVRDPQWLINRLNAHRPKYLEFLKEKKAREEEETRKEKEWWEIDKKYF